MKSDHWNTREVPQDEYAYSDDASLLYTEGLGPCIGVCIAWRNHAWILHSASICYGEHDQVRPMIEEVKRIVPEHQLSSIQPVLCGGDLCSRECSPDEAEDFAQGVLVCRERALDLMTEAGFGEPFKRWNNDGETSSLVADLTKREIYIECEEGKLAHPILW